VIGETLRTNSSVIAGTWHKMPRLNLPQRHAAKLDPRIAGFMFSRLVSPIWFYDPSTDTTARFLS
jgi:hypothetical protein